MWMWILILFIELLFNLSKDNSSTMMDNNKFVKTDKSKTPTSPKHCPFLSDIGLVQTFKTVENLNVFSLKFCILK